ncbi:carbohydrate ABC transporter permease [Salinibacterium sp.]|uniref:carbohydrate ABC transporter permease n=1 Tax=Salinibacterium sp. TaxID=1915057 RepID=UPI00286A8575|nr:carbohydrate ABC transporter permease [Salinibacterium sp.]
MTALFCLPLYIALVNAFKLSKDVVPNPLAFPLPPTLENVVKVVTASGGAFWTSLGLTVAITLFSVLATMLFSGMLAYSLARSQGVAAKIVLGVLLLGLMIPQVVTLGPVVDVLRAIGLFQTLPGLISFNVGGYMPFAVFLFYGFIRATSIETEEAAALDGASRFRTFWQVVFPQLAPVSASVAIFLSVFVWNDFLSPLILLGPFNGDTITVGVYRSIGAYSTDFGTLFATMLLACIPVIVAYLLLQRQFVKGLTAGAVK